MHMWLSDEQWDVQGEAEDSEHVLSGINCNREEWVHTINTVIESGDYNFRKCKIETGHGFNIMLLNSLLADYHDSDVVKYLQYGWPIERDPQVELKRGDRNHKGATEFPEQVDEYIDKEIQMGAIIGPFDSIPFNDNVQVGVSPISTRPKCESDKRRIILDCSWPVGWSLNDGIVKDSYLGECVNLKYPTIDQLAKHVYQLRSSSPEPILLYKEDLDRAFRQLFTCFSSIPLLGFKWRKKLYFDVVLAMGCRIAPYICQRSTNIISYIHRSMGYFLLNYVDDFIGAELATKAWQAHQALIRTLRDMGFKRADSKSVAPTTVLEFIRNLVDTENFTLGITPTRKIEILAELEKWHFRSTCTRNQLESLIGKLQFVSACVKPGRLFISRMLSQLKGMQRGRWYTLSDEFRRDVKWWYMFVPQFQGTCIMWWLDVLEVDGEFATDSCLVGAGGVRQTQYFRTAFPAKLLSTKPKPKIHHLELWAIVIAIKIWGEQMTGRIVRINTDNEAVSQVINTGRAQDTGLQKLLRELVWWLAKYQIRIKGKFLLGKMNKLPDLLSRWSEGEHIHKEFDRLTQGKEMTKCEVKDSHFELTNDW